MAKQLKWGILGAGNIARQFARGVAASQTGTLVAIGSRDQSRADKFAAEFSIPAAHGSYDQLLADTNVQAVYIATPHPEHAEWAIKAAEAKKHLLVEKPLALNHAQAMAIVEAARANDVFLMEAFMYRCHPQTQKLVELIRQRVIGDVRVISACFSFHAAFNPTARLFNNALGGGGILDVGCYCVSMARLIAGVALGKDFAEPTAVTGQARLGKTGVDEWAIASMKFPGGDSGDILAELSTGVSVNQRNVVRIFGSEGHLVLANPWIPARDGGDEKIAYQRTGQEKPTEVVVHSDRQIYAIEADTVAMYIEQRQAASPAMSWDDSLGNMQTLDRWRDAIKLVYDSEKEPNVPTISRRPLKANAYGEMKYARIAGVNKPISRLLMGCDNQRTISHAAAMFDDFFEHGGNAFDTAYIYGGGLQERLLGQWIKMRNVREQVVLTVKGAHTPYCDPASIRKQLAESLDRLGVDHAELYLMHRDNPEIPAGEFVDVLNEQMKAGRISVFGGSNWSTQRVDEANAYAKSHGLQGFSLVSNNFSLARMVEPVWDGCVAASDPASRKWLTEKQIALLAWSSQARGFFVPGVASPINRTDAELVRCWYSDDNFQRQKRANELAQQKKVLPINIALAYVLQQPFPTFALIGPRTLHETHTSLPGLAVTLSPDELKWLNLES